MDALGQYTTPKHVLVKSKSLGVLYYFLVLLISFYVVGFLLYKENGYQKSVPAEGVLAIKVKGTAATNETETGEKRVYDANDLVQYSSDGVFVATRLVKTMQAKGTCLGVSKDEVCSKGKNTCVKGSYSRNGRQTGKCLPSTSDPNSAHFCEIKGWCPPEAEEDDDVLPLENVGNFTVFIRMNVKFPGMYNENGEEMRWDNANGTEPRMGWNLFSLENITQTDDKNFTEISTYGSDQMLNVYFDCNLDEGVKVPKPQSVLNGDNETLATVAIEEGGVQTCSPEIPFVIDRVDNPLAELSSGYNTRWISAVNHFTTPNAKLTNMTNMFPLNPPYNCRFDTRNPETRLLTKAYGPRLRIQFSGVGRRFDVVMLTQTIGAGIALLGIAVVITDAFAKYIPGFKKQSYDVWKFEEHVDEEGDLLKSYFGGDSKFNSQQQQQQQQQQQPAQQQKISYRHSSSSSKSQQQHPSIPGYGATTTTITTLPATAAQPLEESSEENRGALPFAKPPEKELIEY